MIDLEPAARQLATLLGGVTDEQLKAPTPCPDYCLGDLLDHVSGLTIAFAAAATKQVAADSSRAAAGDAAKLGEDWRTRIPAQLDALVQAWRSQDAWQGMTRAGGIDLPGEVAGRVALNELVVHGWDIARATGQPFDCSEQTVAAAMEFVSQMASPEGTPGLFGPSIDVSAEAPQVDRLIGLTGRVPSWTAA